MICKLSFRVIYQHPEWVYCHVKLLEELSLLLSKDSSSTWKIKCIRFVNITLNIEVYINYKSFMSRGKQRPLATHSVPHPPPPLPGLSVRPDMYNVMMGLRSLPNLMIRDLRLHSLISSLHVIVQLHPGLCTDQPIIHSLQMLFE